MKGNRQRHCPKRQRLQRLPPGESPDLYGGLSLTGLQRCQRRVAIHPQAAGFGTVAKQQPAEATHADADDRCQS